MDDAWDRMDYEAIDVEDLDREGAALYLGTASESDFSLLPDMTTASHLDDSMIVRSRSSDLTTLSHLPSPRPTLRPSYEMSPIIKLYQIISIMSSCFNQ